MVSLLDASLNQQRRRRRTRQLGKDCFCPCNGVIGSISLFLLCVWTWLLHRAISYDPNHLVSVVDASTEEWVVPALPNPIIPPDMMTNPHPPPQVLRTTKNDASTSQPPLLLMTTWQSNQHAYNQDRAVYYPTFPNRQQQQSPNDVTFLVGLFDGHGRDGHVMAQFVVEHFGPTLAAKLNAAPCCQSDDWIKAQFNATFFAMEAMAMQQQQPGAAAADFAYTGGCTASVTLRLGDKLYFANAGDSRTMLASDFALSSKLSFSVNQPDDPYTATVWYSTRLDKADLPDERARIERLGGHIHSPPPDKFQPSRVIVTSQHLHDTVGLAMSRSLGDVEWTAVGVTPEPIVDVIHLANNHSRPYLIVASDGMWDCRARRPQFFAKQLGNILFASQDNDAEKSTAKLIDFLKSITPQKPQFYRDDITVIAFAL